MLKDAKAKAAEAAISAARAAGRHRRAAAEAEYEAATDKLLFTKDFNDEFEARMHDKLATVTERVRAWVLRYSWGSWALFAIEQDGYPRHQVDCVNELGIGKNRVSKAVSYLQRRGYMADHPKELRPICSPKLTVPAPRTSAFAQLVELYKVAPSTEWLHGGSPQRTAADLLAQTDRAGAQDFRLRAVCGAVQSCPLHRMATWRITPKNCGRSARPN